MPEESFDLNNVSGSNNDNKNSANDPTDHSCNHVKATTAERADLGVNNLDLPVPKMKSAADIHYFFEKCGDKMVCMVCR